ncbi:hypothetical protein BDQ17DRAFT_1421177 [Cyathus striatus]|nr:hypothetical protein BDQ17DRAFT_1421177 [Cyathus striatus]
MSLSSISSAKRRGLYSAPVFSVLIKDSYRWKKATLTADFEGFCQFNCVPLPALELLYLKFHEYNSHIDQSAVSDITIVKIKYPQLSKLIISSLSSASQALNLVISRLVVPSLQELRVSQFYDCSNPTLLSTIQGWYSNLDPGDLARLLAHTPLLQELYISPIEALDLERLCLHANQIHDPLVPSLKLLQLQSVKNKEVDLPMLSNLGLSRCDFVTKMADGSIVGLHNHGCRPLEILTYEPYDDHQRVDHQEVLEGMSIVESDERLALQHKFWEQTPICDGPSVLQRHLETIELDAFFMLLEIYEIPSPNFFQTSRIHLHLHDVKMGSIQWFPDRNFAERAAKILEKWKPMLIDCLPKRRWAINGQVLQYIPIKSEMRESSDGLRIIFGL